MEDMCISKRQSEYLDALDTWSYIWGNEFYSSIKAYKVLIGHKQTPPHFSWIWKSSCQPKNKVFFWMLLHDRVNTRNLLRGKTLNWKSTIVQWGIVNRKKLCTIFFGDVLLLSDAGISSALQEHLTCQFWRHIKTSKTNSITLSLWRLSYWDHGQSGYLETTRFLRI